MGFLKTTGRIFYILILALLILLGILFIIYFGPSIWKKWVTYPRLEKERAELWLKFKKPPSVIPAVSHKGVMHSHTYWSHDSGGLLPVILEGAKKAKLEFIFLSDHPHEKLDSFPRSYHGIFDGIIIEAGTETSNGLMVQPFDSTVLDWNLPFDEIIHDIVTNGGLVTYVHTEKEHPWGNPDYQAMEIYNIHTDLIDEDGILPFIINSTINGKEYRHWGFRELYNDQTAIWARWDSLNQHRRIVGIGAVDAHNNNSFKARYLNDGQVEWIGPNNDPLSIKKPGLLEKILLGEPDKFGWAFRWEMDPYFNSFNHVNDYVFCDTFSNVNIKDNIIKGHVFVSFESLAEADGFQYFSTDSQNKVTGILGDSVAIDDAGFLKALSPFPVKFQLFNSGKIIDEMEGSYDYEFNLERKPGNYRLVASLWLDDKWIPWILTNPIFVY